MNDLSGKKALITGASSGIGRAISLALGDRGCDLFLIARRSDKLKEVSSLIKNSKVHLIEGDITDSNLLGKLDSVIGDTIDIHINNAGLALGRENVESSHFSDWQEMIDVNITANFKMVHHILPKILKNGGGDIINLCSVAGHYTYQGGAVYCATKHAVKAFTRVLREETCGKNIRVMQISPGMVNTEFSKVRFKGDQSLADAVYKGMTPLLADDIARMLIFMLEQPRHVVIDEIITMPMDQGSPTTVFRGNI